MSADGWPREPPGAIGGVGFEQAFFSFSASTRGFYIAPGFLLTHAAIPDSAQGGGHPPEFPGFKPGNSKTTGACVRVRCSGWGIRGAASRLRAGHYYLAHGFAGRPGNIGGVVSR